MKSNTQESRKMKNSTQLSRDNNLTCSDEISSLFADYPDVVSLTQLGEMLGISQSTCYRLMTANQIRHMRIGRKYLFPKVYVIQYIASIIR